MSALRSLPPNSFVHLWQRMWRSAGVVHAGLAADKAGRLRAEQVSTVIRTTPYMMVANVFSIAVVVTVFWGTGHDGFLIGWASLFLSFVLVALTGWHRSMRRPTPVRVSERAVRRIVWSCSVPAVAWAMAPLILFASAAAPGKLLLASIVLGTLSAGAFGLATVAPAAFLYTGIIAASALAALVVAGTSTYATLGALLVVYLGITWFAIAWFARLFRSNVLHAIEIAEQKELVGLLLNDFQESASDWLCQVDAQGRLVMVSRRLLESLGLTEESVIGRPFAEVLRRGQPRSARFAPDHAAQTCARLFAARDPFASVEMWIATRKETLWWSLSGKPVFDGAGTFQGFRAVGTDITATRRWQQRMTHMAHHDGLTGLPNRTLFQEKLDEALSKSTPVALAILDLDNFKTINDTLGHLAGDTVLIEVASRLRSIMPPDGFVARLGGDEFAVVALGTDRATADMLARRMVVVMSEPFGVDKANLHVGGSVGVAMAPADALESTNLVRRADLALYAAKGAGRGRHRFFEPAIEDAVRERRSLEDDLRTAIGAGALELYFQPLVDLATESVVGAEALIRWRHPQRGFVSPGQFIPIAEESGLILPLGEWVLHEACRQAKSWPVPLSVAVNVSVAQMQSARLSATIVAALSQSGLRPGRLEIEMTESMLVDHDAATTLFAQMKALGVSISLDDFGTGYSSLSYLRKFPFDKIKIDQSFVRESVHRADCAAIVDTVAKLARRLGITTVAEGVETAAELAVVRAAGCERAQGYLYGRPISAEEFAARLDAVARRQASA